MANVLVERGSLQNIADAIRAKNGQSATYTPAQMAAAISAIPTGGGIPAFLAHSTISDVLVNENLQSYDPTIPQWGDLTVSGTPTKDYDGVLTSDASGFDYALAEINHSVTAYAIVKSRTTGGDVGVISVPNANSSGNAPNFYTRGSTWYRSVYGSSVPDVSTNVSSTDEYSVMTLAVDASAKYAHHYVNGIELTAMAFTNSGALVRFNGLAGTSGNRGAFSYLFVGIVDGCEDSTTILANHQDMLNWLEGARS